MSLFERKQQLSQGGAKGKPEKIPSPKEEKKNTSGFAGKPFLRREEFKSWLRRPEAYKASGLPETERVKLEKELFGPKYGFFIEKGEPEKALKKMKTEKFKAPTGAQKAKIDKRIRLIKKFLGK